MTDGGAENMELWTEFYANNVKKACDITLMLIIDRVDVFSVRHTQFSSWQICIREQMWTWGL